MNLRHITTLGLSLLIGIAVFASPARSEAATTIQRPINFLGLQNGLVGWWTFDGKYMTSNVLDASTQGNHGNLLGQTPTTTRIGLLGQALKFDGTDDRVQIRAANQTIASLKFDTAPFSTAFWYKSPEAVVADNSMPVSARRTSGWTFQVDLPNDTLEFFITDAGGGGTDTAESTSNIYDDRWHHVVGLRDGTMVRIYIDGVQEAAVTDNLRDADDEGGLPALRIGASGGVSAASFHNATFDDVRIYNRGLSASEVMALYRSGAAKLQTASNDLDNGSSLESGLVGHWTFDGKYMTSNVRDTSGQGNHGNLTNQTPTTTTIGILGQAMSFDGVNDKVSVTDANNSLDAATVVSISAWIKPRDLEAGSGWHAIAGKGQNYYIGYQDDDFALTFNNAGWHNHFALNYANNQWHHVVGIIDNPNDRVYIYVNGSLALDEAETADLVVNNTVFTIGDDEGQNEYTDGYLDDIRVYSRVLTAAEIKQLYNLGR